jgi:hypothetical protein
MGSSGLGGDTHQGPKPKHTKTAPGATDQVSWILDRVTKCYMKAVNGQTVASRATMVYDNSHVGTKGELLPQELTILSSQSAAAALESVPQQR